MFRLFKFLLSGAAFAAAPTSVFAASAAAPTGVNAGFFDLQTDLTAILQGDGGAAIIVLGVLIGAGMLAASARWTYIVSVMGVAIVLGYGFPVISSMAGVTADIDMVDLTVIGHPVELITSQPLNI